MPGSCRANWRQDPEIEPSAPGVYAGRRKDGRADECDGLENRWAFTGPGGSNPPPSASSGPLHSQGPAPRHLLRQRAGSFGVGCYLDQATGRRTVQEVAYQHVHRTEVGVQLRSRLTGEDADLGDRRRRHVLHLGQDGMLLSTVFAADDPFSGSGDASAGAHANEADPASRHGCQPVVGDAVDVDAGGGDGV